MLARRQFSTACKPMKLSRLFRRSALIWKRCSTRISSFKCGILVAKQAFGPIGGAITPIRTLLSTSSTRPMLTVSISPNRSYTQCLRRRN